MHRCREVVGYGDGSMWMLPFECLCFLSDTGSKDSQTQSKCGNLRRLAVCHRSLMRKERGKTTENFFKPLFLFFLRNLFLVASGLSCSMRGGLHCGVQSAQDP